MFSSHTGISENYSSSSLLLPPSSSQGWSWLNFTVFFILSEINQFFINVSNFTKTFFRACGALIISNMYVYFYSILGKPKCFGSVSFIKNCLVIWILYITLGKTFCFSTQKQPSNMSFCTVCSVKHHVFKAFPLLKTA